MSRHISISLVCVALLAACDGGPENKNVWSDKTAPTFKHVAGLVADMTHEEKITLVHGSFPKLMPNRPADVIIAAGHVPGIPRLGIPPLRETDASLGVSNTTNSRVDDVATPLPSGLMLAATWDPQIAFAGGAMIGNEARAKRFNMMLAGGVNLGRELRNGRLFEYLGEDPLLAGALAGEHVRGIQSNGILSTIKHFALNDQETGRRVLNVKIDEAAARESDLLAFQIAIERGKPASIMTAYNRVRGDFASENDWLLNKVLKGDWGFRGWVMSDWGNVHSAAKAANAGLDQESGEEVDVIFNKQVFFNDQLKAAIQNNEVSQDRLNDMVTRYLTALVASGIYDRPEEGLKEIDYTANATVAQREAEHGIVLLRNERNALPLSTPKTIAIIGGHADVGVLSGGGSSQVRPVGGPALIIKAAGPGASFVERLYHPSSPLKALQAAFPGATITYNDGTDLISATELAKGADAAVVFAEEWRAEARDAASLSLPDNQDALIAAVAAVNKQTVVVLETGGPVLMPWLHSVQAVLAAWYPGARGGEAIAGVIAGTVNPSGRLPITFPASEAQLPRPVLDGLAAVMANTDKDHDSSNEQVPFEVDYDIEGADVGYKWFASKNLKPLFPFGYGLSYNTFDYGNLRVTGGETVTATIEVRNIGARAGIATPQFYAMLPVRGAPTVRLIGWERVALAPGESKEITITADPRLLAAFDAGWKIAAGDVAVSVGEFAGDSKLTASATLAERTIKP